MDEYQALLSIAVDVSKEFMYMVHADFHDFLKSKAGEAVLVLKYQLRGDYGADQGRLLRLGKFLDHAPAGQKRFAVGRATPEAHQAHAEEFALGIKWDNSEPEKQDS